MYESKPLEPFMHGMAHDLRNALGAVMGWVSVLQRAPGATPLMHQGIEAIDRNVRLQATLLEDLLDGSRLCHGDLQLETVPVSPGAVLAEALDEVKLLATRAEVRLRTGTMEESVTVLADKSRLKRMLATLLRAAIEASPKGGAVAISAQTADSDFEIRVADAAIEADDPRLPQLQSSASAQSIPRALLLVAMLAEMQRGRLEVTGLGGPATSGTRTQIRLRLPRLSRDL